MSRNNDYTTGHLLDYLYHHNYYKLFGEDLSRQTNKSIPQQNNFVGKLEEDDDATSLNLMIESELLNKRIFLVKVTLKIGQEKYLLSILF